MSHRILFLFGFLMVCGRIPEIKGQNPTYHLMGTEVCQDQVFDVPVISTNFSDLVSVQFSVNWEIDQLELIEINDPNPAFANVLFNTNLQAEGKMAFSWLDISSGGLNLADSSILFVLRFKGIENNAQNASIDFSNSPAPIESIRNIDGVFTPVTSITNNTSVDLYQPQESTVSLSPASNGMNGSIDLEVEGGKAPYQYLWSNGAQSQDLSGLSPDTYFCTLTDALFCENQLGPYTIDMSTAVSELTDLIQWSIQPNPATHFFCVNLQWTQAAERQLQLFDQWGHLVQSHSFYGTSIEQNFACAALPSGTYWLSLYSKGAYWTQAIIID